MYFSFRCFNVSFLAIGGKKGFGGTLENFLNIFSFLEQRWGHYSSLHIISFPPELFGHCVIQSTYIGYF